MMVVQSLLFLAPTFSGPLSRVVQDVQNGGQTGWVVKARVASPSAKKLSNPYVQLHLGIQVQNEVFFFFPKAVHFLA